MGVLAQASALSPLQIAVLALGLLLAYPLGYAFYNLYLHPLRRYPGPLLWRATWAAYFYHSARGTLSYDILDLHRRYGPVVRISPNEVAFADPQAWKDIWGHRSHGDAEFEKWQLFYRPVPQAPTDIVTAGREEHSQLRRTLAHGFSEKNMRDQQPLIKQYIDLLIQRLREHGDGGRKPVDMAAWYNFTTFDVIGDLAFGESFGCLQDSAYHPWVKLIFQMARVGSLFQCTKIYPFMKFFLYFLMPKMDHSEMHQHQELTKQKLSKRMEIKAERPDLIEGLLKRKDEYGLSFAQLQANASILIIGGSETTATLLSGVTFLLLTNPEPLAKLTHEIRSSFQSEDEIDFTSVSRLPYLLACLDEALRLYPPVPMGLPRVVPKGGAVVAGHHLPEDAIVTIFHWAVYRYEKFWEDPSEFHPERWLGDPRYANDVREVFQPFHIGSRNCIGRNLAYVEMRIILARVLFNFDMRICNDSLDWMTRQKIFNLWEKGNLNTFLVPVSR